MKYTTVLLLALGVVGVGAVKWTAQNADNKTCLIFAAETINVKLNINNTDNVIEPISFTINTTQRVNGTCNADYQGNPANKLEVSFFPNGEMPPSATGAQTWSLVLWFTSSDTASFKLADYSLQTAPSTIFNSTTQIFNKSDTAELDVHASGTNGFKCSTSGLALISDSTIDLKDTKMIAHALLETPDFPAEQNFEQCLLDSRTSDIVPIVVGACLAGLVAVVLVAYLVGRARAKRQGYASV